jgi:GntR family transcriptional regulator
MVDLHSVISNEHRHALAEDSPTPLYHRLYNVLKTWIIDGTLTEGMQLPTEQELAREFGVSRITSKRALDELAIEGLVQRQRGKGTHVIYHHRNEPVHVPMVGLLQEIASLRKDTQATVLDCRMQHPPKAVRDQLGLETGQTALFLSRVRHRDGQRFGYYRSWTLGMAVPEDLDVFIHTPRMTHFRQQGLKVRYMRQVISAQAASPEVAKILDLEPGSPLLSLVRLTFPETPESRYPVDYLKVLYHPDRFEYHIDLDLEDQP